MSKRKQQVATNNEAKSSNRCEWTESMNDFLIDCLVHENNMGRRVNGTFTT